MTSLLENASGLSGDVDDLAVTTIRTLAMDAVQAAASGHPGTAMAMAPVVHTLWQEHLRYDSADPRWPARDRFVLSAGHASALLYAVLHLAQVQDPDEPGRPAVSLDDLKRFRQLGSRCPGHPEHGHTPGVEATTGPLGTGAATAVGTAIAARWLADRYDRPGFALFGYDTYALCGDGDLMEGVAAEAASLAGHLRLSNLCWVYDSNRITIEGATDLAFSEDVAARFAGYGWHVVRVADANDRAAVSQAFDAFRAEQQRPTLVVVESVIGYGAPRKAGTASAHGEPLGAAEVAATKKAYGWPEDAHFLVPDGVYDAYVAGVGARGRGAHARWTALFDAYREHFPQEAAELETIWRGGLPEGWDDGVPVFPADAKGLATRDSSGTVLNAVATRVPWLLGGSADVGPSTKTTLTFDGAGHLTAAAPGGRNLHYGIREFAAAAVSNGLALSGLRPYWSTFLIFSDFARGAIRLSALMGLPVAHVFSHDSIGVGEDGPTHQPIEQLASLRAVPGLVVLRPCDANETAHAWRVVMTSSEPVALVLSRQSLPTLDRDRYAPADGLVRGGYVLSDPAAGRAEVVLLATGSEVHVALAAQDLLAAGGVDARVVSLPSWELFDAQPQEYRDAVLPPSLTARVAVEAAGTFGWERYVGTTGAVVGMRSFGASAPAGDLAAHFGLTPESVAQAAREQLAGQ